MMKLKRLILYLKMWNKSARLDFEEEKKEKKKEREWEKKKKERERRN